MLSGENVEFRLLQKEPEKTSIINFDVNESLELVVSTKTKESKKILVYNNDGLFLYGFYFKCDGNIGVEWGEDNKIIIYLLKSNKRIEIDKQGVITSLVSYDISDYNDHFNHYVFSSKKQIGNLIFKTENSEKPIVVYSHNEIVQTNEDAVQRIVYQASSSSRITSVFFYIFIGGFISAVIIGVYFQIKNKTKQPE